MDLYKEILLNLMPENYMKSFPQDFKDILKDIVEMKCYQALQSIKVVIEDDSLDDPECFMLIEKIICAFEDIGSNGGFRHDFS